MFCEKCGSQLPENAAFCTHCGTKVTLDDAPKSFVPQESAEPAPAPAPAPETEVLSDHQAKEYFQPSPSHQNPSFDIPSFNTSNTPAKKPKKKKTGVVVAVALILVAALLATMVAFNFASASGFFIKTFGSDEDYFKFVETNAFLGYTDNVTTVYKSLSDAMSMDSMAFDTKLSLNVSDDALDMFKKNITEEFELDWIKGLSVVANSNMNDNKQALTLALGLSSTEIIKFDVIVDLENQEFYIGIPSLGNKYLYFSMEDIYGDSYGDMYAPNSVISAAGLSSLDMISDIASSLPSDKEFNDLLNKYIKIVIENLDNVSMSSETLEVDGISEKVSVVELEFDMETLYNICLDVLNTAKNDKDLEKYISNVLGKLEEKELIDDAGEIIEMFKEGIDDAIETLEDESDFDNEELFTLTDYVNSKHEIVGRALEVQKEDIFYYATAHNGKDFATELEVYGECILEGKGTDKNGVLTSELEIQASGMTVCDIILTDFDTNKLEDGYLNGSIALLPSSALLKSMVDSSTADVVSMLDPGLEFKFQSSDKATTVELNLLNDEEMFFGIIIDQEKKNTSKISLPSSNDTYDTDEAEDWLLTLDFDKLEDAVNKTDLPEEIKDLISEALNQIS